MSAPTTRTLSLAQARRMALGAQGLDGARPSGRVDIRHVRREMRRLGVVQLDYVNVLTPAHYQILYSRLGPYDTGRFDEVVYERREFTEQWARERSVVPMEWWPLLHHRRRTFRIRPWGFDAFMEEHADYADRVLEAVRERGPAVVDDVPEPDDGVRADMPAGWSFSVPKAVLEAHFARGRLAIARRLSNFQRVYDVTERVVPEEHRDGPVPREEARRLLLLEAARAQGLGTASDLADYLRLKVGAARTRLEELAEAGALERVEVEGWNAPAYMHAEARLPRSADAVTLLSPFDPVIAHRDRVERLFGFEYKVELFVPRKKRRWGYYVLPFLMGDRLVARVDLKADRDDRRLRVLAAYLEEGEDAGAVAEALGAELQVMAGWLGLGAVVVEGDGGFAEGLRGEVAE